MLSWDFQNKFDLIQFLQRKNYGLMESASIHDLPKW
jgi:hypothetical protein